MKRLIVLCAGLGLALAAFAPAAAASPDCGPGMYIGKSNRGSLIQSFGATTNATLLPTQTLAMTFGTSGCSSDGIVRREVEQEVFVTVNLESLYQDMARGGGEVLDAFAELMGCRGELRGELGRVARANFAALQGEAEGSPAALLAALRAEMGRVPSLAAGCRRLS